MMLRLEGYDVDIAPDGPSGLEKTRAFQPDVVLLDLGLPRMTGFEVAQEIAKHRPRRTPLLVAVTGYADAEARTRSAEAGVDLHLAKPVEPQSLFGLLERFRGIVRS
jgi:CheY-like chemotaxis protein